MESKMGLVAGGKYIIAPDFEITFRPLHDQNLDKLPAETRTRLAELHSLIKKTPRAAIPELLKLKAQFPDIPKIYNYLYNAFILADNLKQAIVTAEENYKKNPDNLFAKINYAYI